MAEPATDAAPVAAGPVQTFRDPRNVQRWLVVALGAYIVAGIVVTAYRVLDLRLIEALRTGAVADMAQWRTEAVTISTRLYVAGRARALIFVAAAIPFMIWLYRANRNARALGASGMRYSPGWAVGWNFVPFANLFMPALVMREIWRGTYHLSPGQTQSGGWLIPVWWCLWLATLATGEAAAVILKQAVGNIERAEIGSALALIQGFLQIALGLVVIVLTRRLSETQRRQTAIAEIF
ncbi:MAG TPA: DUF4328 domain-containing protein [Dongiaceae bacterium]|nr:DUF4328 domain-containing protein [Dongiaceae bacterium]